MDDIAANGKVLFWLTKTQGITVLDVFLLVSCAFCGGLGGLIARHMRLKEYLKSIQIPDLDFDFRSVAREEPHKSQIERDRLARNKSAYQQQYDAAWRHAKNLLSCEPNHVGIGAALGFLIALYFVGAITQEVASVMKVLALSILLGYQAPLLWRLQQRVITRLIDERIKLFLADSGPQREDSSTSEKRSAEQA